MAGVLKKQGSKIKKSPGDRIVDVIIMWGLPWWHCQRYCLSYM